MTHKVSEEVREKAVAQFRKLLKEKVEFIADKCWKEKLRGRLEEFNDILISAGKLSVIKTSARFTKRQLESMLVIIESMKDLKMAESILSVLLQRLQTIGIDVSEIFTDVNVSVEDAIKINRLVVKEGFYTADSAGFPCTPTPFDGSVGILYKDSDTTKRRLFLFRRLKSHIGTVYFGAASDTTKDKWMLKVYGRKYLDVCRRLAEKMMTEFEVTISVTLVQDEVGFERSDPVGAY